MRRRFRGSARIPHRDNLVKVDISAIECFILNAPNCSREDQSSRIESLPFAKLDSQHTAIIASILRERRACTQQFHSPISHVDREPRASVCKSKNRLEASSLISRECTLIWVGTSSLFRCIYAFVRRGGQKKTKRERTQENKEKEKKPR